MEDGDKTELMQACQDGDIEVVKALLAAGADPNARDIDGRTALMWTKKADIAQVLLDAGIELNARDANDYTALYYMNNSGDGYEEIAALLVAAGGYEEEPITGRTELMHACKNGDIEAMKAPLSSGSDLNAQDSLGFTALIMSIFSKRADIAKLLLDAGADVNIKDKNGFTALYYAKHSGDDYDDMIALLAVAGGEEEDDSVPGKTELMQACENFHIEAVKSLLANGVDPNAQDSNGTTALMWTKKADIAKVLLDAGADVNIRDRNDYTALRWAKIKYGYDEVIALLIAAGGVEY